MPSNEFLGCIGYISCYLPKLEYVQWVSNSTPDLKIPSSKPTDNWALEPNPTTKHLLINQDKAQWLTSSTIKHYQRPKVRWLKMINSGLKFMHILPQMASLNIMVNGIMVASWVTKQLKT